MKMSGDVTVEPLSPSLRYSDIPYCFVTYLWINDLVPMVSAVLIY